MSVCPQGGGLRGWGDGGGHAWLQGNACVVAEGVCIVAGGVHGCGEGVCMVAGGMLGCRRVCIFVGVFGCKGVCVVAGGVHGCRGGMRGCRGGVHGCRGVCMVVEKGHAWLWGACMVAGGHARLWGCMVAGGHTWLQGGVRGIRRDTVNERAVRILLECILVVTSLPLSLYSISNFSHIFFSYPYPHLK